MAAALLRRLCADDPEALDLIDRVAEAASRPGERTDLDSNRNEVSFPRPVGTTAEQALRSLRTHAPAIHAEVIAGRLSPHAGAVKAGLRKPTATVPLDPVAMARAIRRRLDDEQFDALYAALIEALAGATGVAWPAASPVRGADNGHSSQCPAKPGGPDRRQRRRPCHMGGTFPRLGGAPPFRRGCRYRPAGAG